MPRRPKRSRPRIVAVSAALALLLAAASCGREDDSPYVEIVGGGFIFNYRNAEASYGIVAKPLRGLPEGGRLIARFENPAGGAPIEVSQPTAGRRERFKFETPPVSGVAKGHAYKVVLTLADASGATLQTIEKSYASTLDQSVLPERPLAIGPGYQANIDGSTSPFPPSVNGPFQNQGK